MKTYTFEEILSMEELYDLQESFSCCAIPFKYKLTDGELGWLEFVKGKYCIADFIEDNLDGDVLTFDDPVSLTKALRNDGMENKAVMLSDETALQKLLFWLS